MGFRMLRYFVFAPPRFSCDIYNFNAAVGDDAGPADPQTHIFLETGRHELCAPNWVLSENQFCLNWGV